MKRIILAAVLVVLLCFAVEALARTVRQSFAPNTSELTRGILYSSILNDTRSSVESQETANPADSFWESADVPTIHVPEEFDSISAAVLELADYGRVIVAAGEYRDNVVILRGRKISIEAEEGAIPVIAPANPALPVLHAEPDAELLVVGVSLRGSRVALLLGSLDEIEPARRVVLTNTRVADSEYGIYGAAREFELQRCIVEHNAYGIILGGSSILADSIIQDNGWNVVLSGNNRPGCDEAAYSTNDSQVTIKNVTIWHGHDGGIAICNVAKATVQNVYLWKNSYVGILIYNTPSYTLTASSIGETQLWNGMWGDGLQVIHSTGQIFNNQFSANKRANVIFYGNSGGAIYANMLIYSVFSICLDGAGGYWPSPTILNNYIFGNTEDRICTGSKLPSSPPPAVPPPSL